MCDVNTQDICKQMHVYWKNEHFQTLLKNNKGNLDQKLISEMDSLIRKIESSTFVVCQQNIVLLNYIYDDLQKGDFSEINQFLQEIKKNMSNLA
ncbi:hypothetical protein BVZ87_00018 [Haemophilus influenzae]|uniref:hypothetical protein n=1 Tax=Haemophilus influenzae TaxID=727 RepID=UPI000CFE7013|nr:hypothetical protein [Haemophilus influenzae]MCK9006234.1 hypothetical protein [Haemophilus influenzae]PRI65759.1 hypothetical protein BVZ87_00018 [Haemophilus influenzae]